MSKKHADTNRSKSNPGPDLISRPEPKPKPEPDDLGPPILTKDYLAKLVAHSRERFERADFQPLTHRLFRLLDNNPALASSIIWCPPESPPIAYPDWNVQLKDELFDAFDKISAAITGDAEYVGLPTQPELAITMEPNDYPSTTMKEEVARQYYMAYVAQSLLIEVDRWVPWSICDCANSYIELLLDSRSLFSWDDYKGAYTMHWATYGLATPGDPFRTYAFLETHNLIGGTCRQTVIKLLSWCTDNLRHVLGPYTCENFEDNWGYPGAPPVEKMIEGTMSEGRTMHWTAGCMGTCGFLRAVLRTVNIPGTVELRCGHSLPHLLLIERPFGMSRKPFPVVETQSSLDVYKKHEGPYLRIEIPQGVFSLRSCSVVDVYLSHGDDPYSTFMRCHEIPTEDMLLDQAEFDELFGWDVSEEERCKNIGYKEKQLAVQYLPITLLSIHCHQDVPAGRGHEESEIYRLLRRYYTLEELEAMDLWYRMEQKIEAMGGCENVPRYY